MTQLQLDANAAMAATRAMELKFQEAENERAQLARRCAELEDMCGQLMKANARHTQTIEWQRHKNDECSADWLMTTRVLRAELEEAVARALAAETLVEDARRAALITDRTLAIIGDEAGGMLITVYNLGAAMMMKFGGAVAPPDPASLLDRILDGTEGSSTTPTGAESGSEDDHASVGGVVITPSFRLGVVAYDHGNEAEAHAHASEHKRT